MSNTFITFAAGLAVGVVGTVLVFKNNFKKAIEKKVAEKLEEKAEDLKK